MAAKPVAESAAATPSPNGTANKHNAAVAHAGGANAPAKVSAKKAAPGSPKTSRLAARLASVVENPREDALARPAKKKPAVAAKQVAPKAAPAKAPAVEAVAVKAVVNDPVVVEPVAEAAPVVVEPIAIEPIVVEAVASEPVVVAAVAAEPVAAEPVVAEPVVIETAVRETAAVEPVVFETVVVERLAVDESGAAEPVATAASVSLTVRTRPAGNAYANLFYPFLIGPLTVCELARGGAQTMGLCTALARNAFAWQRAALGALRPR
ncbi:MAG: hypothetical protein ACLPYS_08345 [Vulcanimicrobiaceae bacterium]